jgi:purine nucleosidase
MQKVHLDTDFAGDIDDLCALALLLRWPEIEITGITTVAELDGRRAGYVRYVLMLEERNDIPVAAGADNALGFYPYTLGLPSEERYWPEQVAPTPNPHEEAVELLKKSIQEGAAIIAIGPLTNLYLLDQKYPGILEQSKLFCMGGYVFPTRPGYPKWGNDMDFNVQIDVRSAGHVINRSSPTLVPLTVTVETALRADHLAYLRGAGLLGELIARQADSFVEDEQIGARFVHTCPALPPDIINFQHDPLTCAIALGWDDGVEIAEVPLVVREEGGLLTETVDPAGRIMQVVTKIDGPRFNQFWLDRVTGRG